MSSLAGALAALPANTLGHAAVHLPAVDPVGVAFAIVAGVLFRLLAKR